MRGVVKECRMKKRRREGWTREGESEGLRWAYEEDEIGNVLDMHGVVSQMTGKMELEDTDRSREEERTERGEE